MLGIGGSGGAEGGGGPVYGMPLYAGSVGTVEQIAVALVRLQQDMNNVLTRLQTLESLALAQQQVRQQQHNRCLELCACETFIAIYSILTQKHV